MLYLLLADDESNVILFLLTSIIALAIYFWMIANAVANGARRSGYIRMMGRIKALELLKAGYTVEEVKKLFTDNDDAFWDRFGKMEVKDSGKEAVNPE